jgi:hypothetical protein
LPAVPFFGSRARIGPTAVRRVQQDGASGSRRLALASTRRETAGALREVDLAHVRCGSNSVIRRLSAQCPLWPTLRTQVGKQVACWSGRFTPHHGRQWRPRSPSGARLLRSQRRRATNRDIANHQEEGRQSGARASHSRPSKDIVRIFCPYFLQSSVETNPHHSRCQNGERPT